MTRLYEYDKEEYWDIQREAVRSLGGRLTREAFEIMWSEFCEMKRKKELN